MMIKFFARGTGGGESPVGYVCDKNHEVIDAVTGEVSRQPRDPEPEVLRGNPEITVKLINSISNKWKYSSGVMSYAKEDNPSSKEIEDGMNAFEELAFSGMEKDQYDILWVKQTHLDRVELHMIIPRVELTTGKAFNPAPPGWEKYYDSLRDSMNYEHGWARPDDPLRARLVQPGPQQLIDAVQLRAGLTPDTQKTQIHNWIVERVASGQITDRAGVIESLSELGEITRQGKDYVSLKVDGTDRAIRFKGALYDNNFTTQRLEQLAERKAEREANGRSDVDRNRDAESAARARQELDGHMQRRAFYHQGRYGISGESDLQRSYRLEQRSSAERPEGHRSTDAFVKSQREARGEILDHILAYDSGHMPKRLRSDLGLDQPRPGRSQQSSGDARGESGQAARADRSKDVGILRDTGRQEILPLKELEDFIRESDHDTIRNDAAKVARAAIEAARAGHENALRSDHDLAAKVHADRDIAQATRDIARAIDAASDVAVGKLKMNRDDEIVRFKKEINLVEFMQAYGYTLDKKLSSKSNKVMRRDDEKLCVRTDKDGTGEFFNVHDSQDNGTIIDFIQRRESINLGQVRKELRPWINESSTPSRTLTARRPIEERVERPTPVERNLAITNAAWLALEPYQGHYLEKVRGLSKSFTDRMDIKQDERGNACFPHSVGGLVCGWEKKNDGFTGFSEGGMRADCTFTRAPDKDGSRRMIVTESAIDAMSYLRLNGLKGDTVVSLGGEPTDTQLARLSAISANTPTVIATDRDQGGDKIAEKIMARCPTATRELPIGKDWNEDLVQSNGAKELETAKQAFYRQFPWKDSPDAEKASQEALKRRQAQGHGGGQSQ